MTRAKLNALTDRELDALVATIILGRMVEGDREMETQTYFEKFGSGSHARMWQRLPRYSTDLNSAHAVLKRVATWEARQRHDFLGQLFDLVTVKLNPDTHTQDEVDMAQLMSTPRQLMTAALLAMEGK